MGCERIIHFCESNYRGVQGEKSKQRHFGGLRTNFISQKELGVLT